MPAKPELLWLAAAPQPAWLDDLPIRVNRLEEGAVGDAAVALAIAVESEADLHRHRLSGRPQAILLVGPPPNAPAIVEAVDGVTLLRVRELSWNPQARTLAVGTTGPARMVSLIAETHTVHVLDLEHVEFLQRMVDVAPSLLRTIKDATGASYAELADSAHDPPELSAARGLELDPEVLDTLWDLLAQLRHDETTADAPANGAEDVRGELNR